MIQAATFAEDRFEEWATAPREELARLHRELLIGLGRLEQALGNDGAAAAALRQVLGDDPTDEPAHRALMRLFAANGDRAQAVRQYHACRDALRRELDVEQFGPCTLTDADHPAGKYKLKDGICETGRLVVLQMPAG